MLAAAAVILAIVNGVNALNKGGDFTDYVEGGSRLLRGESLYEGSGIGGGVIGPPFQSVLLAPFAALSAWSLPAGRLAWYLLNLAGVVAGIRWWHLALAPSRFPAAAGAPGLIVWPLAAVGFPLQSNFEHQNINGVLLALTGLAAWRGTARRDRAAGAWLGAAVAVKVFPAILALVLVARRAYRAAAVTAALALVLTLLPILRYGPAGYVDVLENWMSLSGSGGWPIRRHNQSLFAMLGRYLGPGDLLSWGPLPETASASVHTVWLLASAALVAGTLWIVWRGRNVGREGTAVAFAAGLALAVLVSPIAWEHYWLLLWPAFAVCYRPPPGTAGWVRVAFWAGAVLTTGLSHPTVGRTGVALARGLSLRTWAALLVLCGTLAAFRALRRGAPQRIS